MTDEELKKMYEGKEDFVRRYLKPMILAMRIGAKNVAYERNGAEVIRVTYEGDTEDYQTIAVVSGDNYRGMLIDLIKQNAI